jgi:hypothetical protein
VLTLLENGEEAQWGVRAKLGWYRVFIRKVSAGAARILFGRSS